MQIGRRHVVAPRYRTTDNDNQLRDKRDAFGPLVGWPDQPNRNDGRPVRGRPIVAP